MPSRSALWHYFFLRESLSVECRLLSESALLGSYWIIGTGLLDNFPLSSKFKQNVAIKLTTFHFECPSNSLWGRWKWPRNTAANNFSNRANENSFL